MAKKEHFAALAQLASRIAAVREFGAGAGPSSKVKELALINRLQSQASSEANRNSHCDDDLAKATVKKGDLQAGGNGLLQAGSSSLEVHRLGQ